MGGGQSSSAGSSSCCWPRRAPVEVKAAPEAAPQGRAQPSRPRSTRDKTASVCRRLRKLQELDEHTRVPFILVELRGHGPGDGYVEICGKDEYGVYEALDSWLRSAWKCTKLDAGDFSGEGGRVPFCDALYRWEGFMSRDSDGVNNMGLATMQLIDLMCRKLSWTLGVINGGNVGPGGDIREHEVIFKAPHPMSMVVPHLLVELRTVGSISLSGDPGAMDELHDHWVGTFGAQRCKGHEDFCERHYTCQQDIFKARGQDGENNLGWLTVKVCDDIVKLLPRWSLATMTGGNHGRDGTHREQQLVFRRDDHPLGQAPHFLVELREAGFVQETGQNVDGVRERLHEWLLSKWSCAEGSEVCTRGSFFYERKMGWAPKDMMLASAEITSFFHRLGWQMQVCSQGNVVIGDHSPCGERQILFRPRSSNQGHVEPHLFIELYTGEGDEELYDLPDALQVPQGQHISICEVGDCGMAAKKLRRFIGDYLGGSPKSEGGQVRTYNCQIFLSRGVTENNLGLWTMRVCDFMVDHLGWSFVVCNVCNTGASRHIHQQQLVFRYDGERPEIPLVKPAGRLKAELFRKLQFPGYWCIPEVLSLRQAVGIVPCGLDEVAAMQDIFDATFKRVLDDDVHRLQVVHAFRSEHAELYRSFMHRRSKYSGGTPFQAKTLLTGGLLNQRLLDGEALLAHGTNPSSAMGILRAGFKLDNAGKATGRLYGHGIYLAECVSQSDRYACDDSGGNYPELRAMLLCRCLVGRPFVVQESGDHVSKAKAAGCDCVVGDREAKLGLFREFIFFDERQVLPEYAVIYRRQHGSCQVPMAMRWPFQSAAKRAAAALKSLQCMKPAGVSRDDSPPPKGGRAA